MTTAMGPPESPNPSSEPVAGDQPPSMKAPMGPPPLPRNDAPKSDQNLNDSSSAAAAEKSSSLPPPPQRTEVPYTIPPWSGAPCHQFGFEVLKDGSIIDQFGVYEKGAYMFGRVDLCDFVLDHPTISRFHAVVQYKRSGEAYVYDLGSTHGTFINKKQVEKKTYVDLRVGDVIRFGQSSRLYIFQGPTDLMPPEINLKIKRDAKFREEMVDREASLQRARKEASLAEGISWGMGEDAIEEDEDDLEEITWQTYKGQLTEKQEKTREKVIKRLEKIAHMKKEIDAIRAKDISQGGLTQGQQTQIARNEQRTAQIMEELENLEETLNDSIRESLGARGKLSTWKKKGGIAEEDEYLSDDDDFYDRTKKKPPVKKGAEDLSVETADSLLDKRDTIMKEIEEKKESLLAEKNRMELEKADEPEAGDELDTFMSSISSQLVIDKTSQIEENISTLQNELDRISYLLKLADPTGEASRKRVLKVQDPMPNKFVPVVVEKQVQKELKKSNNEPVKPTNILTKKEATVDAMTKVDNKSSTDKETANAVTESKTTVYVETKPQWLGAVDNRVTEENQLSSARLNDKEADDFVDYKDRNKMRGDGDNAKEKAETDIESAAPGLIIRKRKQKQICEPESNKSNDSRQQTTPSMASAELMAMDAVALLLKHQSGSSTNEEDDSVIDKQETRHERKGKKEKRPKRVLGPEEPSFLDSAPELETWVPPEGQSGDGRTSLNDRYGY